MTTDGKHPAPFTDTIIEALSTIIPANVPAGYGIHDPFGGEGVRLGALCDRLGYAFTGTDLEEWIGRDPRVALGDATDNATYPLDPYVVVTSPCLAHGQQVLRDDLRWIPVQDVQVGDVLVSFDEYPTSLQDRRRKQRRWRLGEVTHSTPQPAEVVEIGMENGDSVICTLNHPWLCELWPNSTSSGTKWVKANDLLGEVVLRQLPTWNDPVSFDDGWLSGMYDGEGTFSHGERTSLKLSIVQKPGALLERLKELLNTNGYTWRAYQRADGCEVIFINGGLNAAIEALGRIRPIRLLNRWKTTGHVWGRCVVQGAERVRVATVTPLGERMIQGITTTTGTYIGNGYLHHNTYNNGVNDHFEAKDSSRRLTYRSRAGHALGLTNTGRWSGRSSKKGEAEYWRITYDAVKCWSDIVIVNVKDSIRRKTEIYSLVDRWEAMLMDFGYSIERVEVVCPGWRYGTNGQARVDTEAILIGHRDTSRA